MRLPVRRLVDVVVGFVALIVLSPVFAVLSIAGPTFRMGLSDATRFGSLVRASADQITVATGGQRR